MNNDQRNELIAILMHHVGDILLSDIFSEIQKCEILDEIILKLKEGC